MNFFLLSVRRAKYLIGFSFFAIFYSVVAFAQSGNNKPKDTELDIFPNPAKKNTSFKLTLKKRDVVTLDIYDSKGVFVKRIYDNETLDKGVYKKLFDRQKKEGETYKCVLTSPNNNGKYTDYLIFEEDDVTATSSPDLNKGFTIGPNPTSSLIEINSPGKPVTGVVIHDMIGNTILNEKVDFLEQHNVNLASLHPGVYFLTLRRKEEAEVVRIVKTE